MFIRKIYGEAGQYLSPRSVEIYNEAHQPVSFRKPYRVYRRWGNPIVAMGIARACSTMWEIVFDHIASNQRALLQREAN